jgi:hypothetical protein
VLRDVTFAALDEANHGPVQSSPTRELLVAPV